MRKRHIADCQTELSTTKSTKGLLWGKECCCHHLLGKSNLLHLWIAPIRTASPSTWLRVRERFYSSLMFSAAWESMAFNSGSDSDFATNPKGGSSAESSSSEDCDLFFLWKSTNIVSACLRPRPERQRSRPSEKVRRQPHPETHR